MKTDSGYPKDTGFILFTLATPRNPLRYNTHRSAPPVSALAHSRGPRKTSQSPVNMLEHRETYGQAQVCSKGHQGSSVDRPCQPSFHLRLEFLLKTDSGCPGDAEVTLFTLANPEHSLRFNTIGQLHQSPPSPVPGDLGRCPSHQSHASRT